MAYTETAYSGKENIAMANAESIELVAKLKRILKIIHGPRIENK